MPTGRAAAPPPKFWWAPTPWQTNLIREGKCYQIPSILQSGAALGMHSLNADLARLVATGRITREAAERCATDKSDLRNYL